MSRLGLMTRIVTFGLILSLTVGYPFEAYGFYPPIVEKKSLKWLKSRNDPAATGIQPVRGREQLLVSYTIPPGDLPFLIGRSYTYDNAAGAIALLLWGQQERAQTILSNVERLMDRQGTLGFSYQVNSSSVDSRVRTGALAWVGYAMLLYQQVTQDDRFQGAAVRIGEYLKGLETPLGSLKGGPDVAWVSTEHNVDAYFFFRELYRVTGNATYRAVANRIRESLLTHLWVTAPVPHFLRGIRDDTPALDANVLGALFLSAIGQRAKASDALRYVEQTFRNRQTIPGSARTTWGYAPDANRGTIWLEGTFMTALAYWRLAEALERAREAEGTGRLFFAQKILSYSMPIREDWIAQGRWRGGFPYAVAVPRYINPDGDTFAEWESVAATSWYLISAATGSRQSIFLNPD